MKTAPADLHAFLSGLQPACLQSTLCGRRQRHLLCECDGPRPSSSEAWLYGIGVQVTYLHTSSPAPPPICLHLMQAPYGLKVYYWCPASMDVKPTIRNARVSKVCVHWYYLGHMVSPLPFQSLVTLQGTHCPWCLLPIVGNPVVSPASLPSETEALTGDSGLLAQ